MDTTLFIFLAGVFLVALGVGLQFSLPLSLVWLGVAAIYLAVQDEREATRKARDARKLEDDE